VRVDLVTASMTVTGRLGAGTAHVLHDAVSVLLGTGQPRWTVDVSALDVTDQSGLQAIAGSYRRALQHERRMVLRGASPGLRHALVLLRLEQRLTPAERAPADSVTG
jgi:anti-anti-sigma regulatory factor